MPRADIKREDMLDTLPKLLRFWSMKNPNGVALRAKDRGIWQRHTWETYFNKVKNLAMGLTCLGAKRGQNIAILGENKPQWYCAELAAQSIGCAAVGIFTDCVPSEIKYYMEDAECVFIVVHDQEQVDKMLEIKDGLPLLKNIIFWDTKGMWNYQDDILLSFDQVSGMGEEFAQRNPDFFDQAISDGKADDIATICYTSGTTGKPKGTMLNHRWMVEAHTHWAKRDGWFQKGFNYVSFIPGAWAAEQGFGIAGNLCAGVMVNFPEKPETVQGDLREIAPELLFYGARQWELLNRTIQAKMMDSTAPRRITQRFCIPIGKRVAKLKVEMKKVPVFWRTLNLLAYHAFFRQLRDNLGLSKAKVVYSAGAAVSPDIIIFFKSMGVEIKLYYGSTEVGAISVPETGKIRPETTGTVLPWAQVKISEEGEILVKNKYMYSGYYNNIERTKEKIEDGWFRTGDFGYIDEEDHLIVIDRMEDLKALASGKRFSPQYAEIRLRFSPYIKDVLVVGGEDVEYVACLINIDMENVGNFAEKQRVQYTTFADLSQKPETIQLIRKEIKIINRTLPDHARIRKFINLAKELDADEAELTRTRKLRRTFVEGRYHKLIRAIYDGELGVDFEDTITYRDGKTALVKMHVLVNAIEEKYDD